MVISYREIRLQFILNLVVVVHAEHLWCGQSVAATTATSATAEASVTSVVHVTEYHNSAVILHIGPHNALSVSVFRTHCQVDVCQESFVHSLLDTEVQHCLFLTIINASHPCEVTLFVIGLHLLYNRSRKILQRCLCVACHEFLTVHHYLLYLLTIDGNLSAIINLCSRQAFHEFLYHRTFWCSVGSSIINEGILLYHHLCCNTIGNNLLQQYSISFHIHFSEGKVIVVADSDVSRHCLVTDDTHLEDILAIFWGFDRKISIHIADSSCYVSRVYLQQLDSYLHNALL